jgi:hypothetical protein
MIACSMSRVRSSDETDTKVPQQTVVAHEALQCMENVLYLACTSISMPDFTYSPVSTVDNHEIATQMLSDMRTTIAIHNPKTTDV